MERERERKREHRGGTVVGEREVTERKSGNKRKRKGHIFALNLPEHINNARGAR